MGLDFIRDKGESYVQKRDKSKTALESADLFSGAKPDVIVPVFSCLLTDLEATLEPGLLLVAKVPAKGESDILVLKSGKPIGTVLPSDAAELLRLIRLNHQSSVISLVIESEPAWDGVFSVKAKKPFKKI